MIDVKKISKGDILWNYTGTIFNFGISFMQLPFLLLFLDSETLGLWYVMNSLAGIANLFAAVFTPAFSRNVAYCWNGADRLEKTGKKESTKNTANINYRLLKTILISSRYIYLLISVVAGFCLLVAGTIHINRIAADILTKEIWISWGIFLAAICLNIYYGYFSSYLMGVGYVKKNNQVLIISGIIRIAVIGILMMLGKGILAAAVAYLVSGLCSRILSKNFFFHAEELKDYMKNQKKISISLEEIKQCFGVIWYNAWRGGAASVSEYLSTQAGTLVCSSLLTLSETAAYSLMSQLVNVISRIAISISDAYVPVFHSAYVTDDKKTCRETLSFCVFMMTSVYIIGIAALEMIGFPIVRWIKPSVSIDRMTMFGYGIYQFLLSLRNCYGRYLSNTNRVIYWKSYLITSSINVVIYSVLMYSFQCGIWGMIIVSIVAESVYNCRKWPGLVNRELELNYKDIFWIGARQLQGMLFGKIVRN